MISTYIQIQCTTSCHAGQLWYAYTVTQESNNQVPGIAQMAARNKRHQGAANFWSGGPIPRKHSSDGATWHASGNQACYSFIDPGGMKGWVGLVGWPVADGLPT